MEKNFSSALATIKNILGTAAVLFSFVALWQMYVHQEAALWYGIESNLSSLFTGWTLVMIGTVLLAIMLAPLWAAAASFAGIFLGLAIIIVLLLLEGLGFLPEAANITLWLRMSSFVVILGCFSVLAILLRMGLLPDWII